MSSLALSFFRPCEVGELLPLYKTVETKVEAQKSEFWNIQGSYMPDKALCDRVSDAAGISYTENCGVRTERIQEPFYGYTELVFIGFAQGEVTEPDGTKRVSSVCEYEYNVHFRAEEDFLKDEGKEPGERKYTNEKQRKLYILGLLKAARQRANTGARRRVIHELTGMKTGFKNLFNNRDSDTATVTFRFKKVVANPENELVLKAGLDNMFGIKNSLYGPSTALPEPTTERTITVNAKPLPKDIIPENASNQNLPGDFSDISMDDIIEPSVSILQEINELLANQYLPPNVKQRISIELKEHPTEDKLMEIKTNLEKVITVGYLRANKNNSQLLPQTMIDVNKFLDKMTKRQDVTYEDAVALKRKVERELERGDIF